MATHHQAFADYVAARAKEEGWPEDVAQAIALDPTVGLTKAGADVAFSAAAEMRALFKLSGIKSLFTDADPAAVFVKLRAPINDVKDIILDLRAEQSEASHIDTAPRSDAKGTTEALWALRRQQTGAAR